MLRYTRPSNAQYNFRIYKVLKLLRFLSLRIEGHNMLLHHRNWTPPNPPIPNLPEILQPHAGATARREPSVTSDPLIFLCTTLVAATCRLPQSSSLLGGLSATSTRCAADVARVKYHRLLTVNS